MKILKDVLILHVYVLCVRGFSYYDFFVVCKNVLSDGYRKFYIPKRFEDIGDFNKFQL